MRVTRGSRKRSRNDEVSCMIFEWTIRTLTSHLQNFDVDVPQPSAKRKALPCPSASNRRESVTALKASSTNKSSDEIEDVEPTYDAKTVRTGKYSVCS